MIRIGVILAGLWLLVQPAVAAITPMEAIKETAGGVLSALRDPALKSNRDTRQERIKTLLRARFDFEEMGKRSLGPNWSKQSPADQQQFVKQFTELLMTTYIDRVDDYQGEKIIYQGERQENETATVNTKVQDKKGREYSVNYRLVRSGEDWKVFDVVIEDVSLVNNYRSQFSRVLSSGSFAELLQKLSAKQFQGGA